MNKEIIKSAAVLIRDKKILMVKDFGESFLGMVGGTVEPNESFISCLQRELDEEIQIDSFKLVSESALIIAEAPAMTDPSRTLKMTCFQITTDQDPKPGNEIEEIFWISRNDLIVEKDEVKLKSGFMSKFGEELTLSPITEKFIFPELVRLGLI